MKNLFEAERVKEVKERLARLSSDSGRLWGKMNPAQVLAHCSLAMEWAVGDKIPPRMFWGRIIGRIVKPLAPAERRTAAPEFAHGDRSCGAG